VLQVKTHALYVHSEERRLKNIRQNEALLAELDLKGAAEGLGLPPPRTSGTGKRKSRVSAAGEKKPRPVRPRKKAEAKAERVAPRRQSTRLAFAIADASETPVQKKQRLVRVYSIYLLAHAHCVPANLLAKLGL
jgi:hypothetical protein